MGLAERHAYRFGYLQSEHWQNLRIRKLAECDARCHICNHRDIGNDVHHIYYPSDIYQTELHVLRVLCRKHHEMVHDYMDGIKDRTEPEHKSEGAKFRYHLEIFRAACLTIESAMAQNGEACCTVKGVRLRTDGHLDRLMPNRLCAELALVKQIKAARTRIQSVLAQVDKNHGLSIMDDLDRALEEANHIVENKEKTFVIDFIRNETAG